MASLPKLQPGNAPLTLDELVAIAGTPDFEKEYRRQMAAIAEQDRTTKNASRMQVDWEALGSWE